MLSKIFWVISARNISTCSTKIQLFCKIPSCFSYGKSEKKHSIIPDNFNLFQNYPNPFNPSTAIEFSNPRTEFVTLKIYDLLGQEVATLVSDKLKAGNYTFTWDAGFLASGVYYYQLKAGDPLTGSGSGYVQSRKMILLQ